jgi:SRSO17 transposase
MHVSEPGMIEVNEAPPPLELTLPEIAALADELMHYHAAFADLYYRAEQAHWAFKYLQGVLLSIERKSIEPMALTLEGGNVQAMQQLIGQGQWQDTALLRKHWALVDETLGEADGVWITDGSDLPKQGEHSVGVARQWCGHVGQVENCQAGVFAAYVSRKGYTLHDRRLYLPEEWFDAAHRGRWKQCGITEETPFTTKPALALEMLREVVAAGTLHFRLVPGEATPQRVDQLAAAVPMDGWQTGLIKEGSKGPLVAEFAFHRGVAVRAGLPGPDVWIMLRRALGENSELKVYLSNAPGHTPVAELVRVAGMRWPIETAFEESKGGLGLDHYEGRSWLGWQHHMTLCLLAHHFLVHARHRVKKGLQR